MYRSVDGEPVLVSSRCTTLASFKAPKHVLEVATIGRAPNGKVDYKRLREEAVARVG